jgi:hypothetical protein
MFEQYSIICLCETWIYSDADFGNYLPSHTLYTSCRDKNKHGGVAVYVKNSLSKCVKRIMANVMDSVYLLIDKTILQLDHDIILGTLYVSPEHSLCYQGNEKDGLDILQDCLYEINAKYDARLILTGDFNCRTGHLDDFISDDDAYYIPGGDWYVFNSSI